jgi:glycosyltransferase involved in cell wall biosynthesis
MKPSPWRWSKPWPQAAPSSRRAWAEIVQDGVTGFLIDRDSPHSLVAALSRLLADKHLRERIGGVARTSVIERFDRQNAIDQIERLYMNDSLEEE